jgi:hypothetical protein
VDLRTFLPPPAVETAEPPAVGDDAPPFFGEPVDTPTVIAFLRHSGCPFAEWTGKEMRVMAAIFPDVDWVAVSHASAAETDQWCTTIGGLTGVRVVIDTERVEYGAWGLGKTSLAHFAGPRSLGTIAKLTRDGIRNRHPSGTRWQQAGTFAIGTGGRVLWRHIPEHAGDLPDLGSAAAAVNP